VVLWGAHVTRREKTIRAARTPIISTLYADDEHDGSSGDGRAVMTNRVVLAVVVDWWQSVDDEQGGAGGGGGLVAERRKRTGALPDEPAP